MHLLYFQIPNFLKPFMTNISQQWTVMVRYFNYVDPHFKAFVCGYEKNGFSTRNYIIFFYLAQRWVKL